MPNKDRNIPKRRFKAFENADAWELRKVGEICSISTGKSNTQDRDEQGKFPFYVRSPIIEKSTKYLFDEEAVLTVGDGVGTGKVFHYVNGKYDLHQRVYRMFSFTHVNAKYFYYYFSKKFFDRVMAMTAKNSVDSVRLEMISDMEITFPQLEEQEKIVKVLSTLDRQITLHQRKLDKLKHVKQAYLSEMFPAEGERVPKRRFPGFTDAWELRKLGEVSSHRGGTAIENFFSEDGKYKVISIGSYGLDNKYVDQNIRAVENEVTRLRVVNKNELTMVLNDKTANGNIIGRCLLIETDDEFVINQRTEIINFDNEVNPKFAYVVLNGVFREQVKKIVQGGTQIYVNYSSVEQLSFSLPTLPEQSAIGNFFSTLDQQITLHQRKLEKLKNLKKALLNELFV
ncbi:restriction endonuclease subunit S [Streptococcus suis]|uniref:restriction endonuclease subunit S n=1 Tax=Streptococcus suis TaxID=1307 RepID=UPI001FC8F8BF|nr:restriction endonuclease subunit S [Streptococcus suis]